MPAKCKSGLYLYETENTELTVLLNTSLGHEMKRRNIRPQRTGRAWYLYELSSFCAVFRKPLALQSELTTKRSDGSLSGQRL